MDSNIKYKIEFTEDCQEEIKDIYRYISEILHAEIAAIRLMKEIKNNVMNLAEFPRLYVKMEKTIKLKQPFRRIVVKNYIILYTVDEVNRIVYIAHMYYGKRNYFKEY